MGIRTMRGAHLAAQIVGAGPAAWLTSAKYGPTTAIGVLILPGMVYSEIGFFPAPGNFPFGFTPLVPDH